MALQRRQSCPYTRTMRSKLLVAAGLLLWLASCVPHVTEATGRVYHRPEDRFFDVLSYNIALLPEPVSYTLPTVRAARMAPHLAGFDALVLQEAFIDGARERLIEELAEIALTCGISGFILASDDTTMTETFAHLTVGLAIFDRNQTLALFNPALVQMWQVEPAWLARAMAFLDRRPDAGTDSVVQCLGDQEVGL